MRFHEPHRHVRCVLLLAEVGHFSLAWVVFSVFCHHELLLLGYYFNIGLLPESCLFIRKWPTHHLPQKMISALWSFCSGAPRRVLRLDKLAFWQTAVTHYIWYFVLQVMWFILERRESAPPNKTKSQIHLSPAQHVHRINRNLFHSNVSVTSALVLYLVSNDTQLSNRENERLAFSWHLLKPWQNLITDAVALESWFNGNPLCSLARYMRCSFTWREYF